MIKSLPSRLILLFFVCGLSCVKDEPCSALDCNTGTFDVATCACDCPEGYSGDNCESLSADVQFWLDSGDYTPLELIDEGVPADSIYGKHFADGIIFYLDINDDIPEMEGMVAYPADNPVAVQWGCLNADIPGLPVISNLGENSDENILPGTRIGDGESNTNFILDAICQSDTGNDNIAARACRDLGPAWFLPSRGELESLTTNLDTQNDPTFIWGAYWTSTRGPNQLSYTVSTHSFTSQFRERNMYERVRAVKAF